MIKQPPKPMTRAEKRRAKRDVIKQINPPKYMGPTEIYTESHREVDGVMKKGYMVRRNFKTNK